MKKITTTILCAAFISAAFTTAAQNGGMEITNATADWKTFKDKNYSVQYPAEWDLNKEGTMGTTFILFSQPTSTEDEFRENVNLLIQDLTGHDINLDKYVEISEGQVKTLITDSKIIESKRIKNAHEEHHRIIYTGKQGKLNLKYEQCYWVIGNKAYVLTFTCEKNQFDLFKETGETIINSFAVKN